MNGWVGGWYHGQEVGTEGWHGYVRKVLLKTTFQTMAINPKQSSHLGEMAPTSSEGSLLRLALVGKGWLKCPLVPQYNCKYWIKTLIAECCLLSSLNYRTSILSGSGNEEALRVGEAETREMTLVASGWNDGGVDLSKINSCSCAEPSQGSYCLLPWDPVPLSLGLFFLSYRLS